MIYLRPISIDDLEFVLEVRNDFSTRNNLGNDTEFSLEECKTWFNNKKPNWFIVEDNGKKIGYFRTDEDEVGCDIHPSERKKGYAREAYKIYLKHKTFASLWVFEDNFAKKLYESLGFTETGEHTMIRGRKYLKMIYGNK